MEMTKPPTLHKEEKNPFKKININDLKTKEQYKFDKYNLTVGLLGEKIIFICNQKESSFQTSKSYDSLTKEIPNFKSCQNITSIYTLLKSLFSYNKYEIKNDGENIIKIIIKLKDMLGNDEMHDIILYHIELDAKTKMKLMDERIKSLEKKVEDLTKENNEIKEKVNTLFNFYNENKMLREEKDKLKDTINIKTNKTKKSNKNNPLNVEGINNSKIIKNKNEIDFILKEVEKGIGSINFNNIKLIYRATRDGGLVRDFHYKCDNIKNTLMIVQTSEGYKFGGFTSTGWNNEKGKDIYDKKAFCFSINLNKIYNIVNPKYALHIQSYESRPSFGSNSYTFLLENEFLKSKDNYVQKMLDYKGEAKNYEINGGNENFKVSELEVFQIS